MTPVKSPLFAPPGDITGRAARAMMAVAYEEELVAFAAGSSWYRSQPRNAGDASVDLGSPSDIEALRRYPPRRTIERVAFKLGASWAAEVQAGGRS